MSFTRTMASEISEEIRQALAGVEKKYGVTITHGNVGYSNVDMRMTMVVKSNDANELAKEFDIAVYAMGCEALTGYYGKNLKLCGEDYTVKGVLPRGKKYNIKATKVSTGEDFKVSAQALILENRL